MFARWRLHAAGAKSRPGSPGQKAGNRPRGLDRVRLAMGLLTPLFALTGCFPSVKIKEIEARETQLRLQSWALIANRPSEATVQLLRINNLAEVWRRKPRVVIASLEEMRLAGNGHALNSAIAELALLEARKSEGSNPEAAAGWYLLAAARAFAYLFPTKGSGPSVYERRFHQMRELYNHATGKYVMMLPRFLAGPLHHHHIRAGGQAMEVIIESGEHLWPPDYFDQYLLSQEIAVEGLRNHYRRGGLGAALTAIREVRRDDPVDRFYPPSGICYPITAVLRFAVEGADGLPRAWLGFYDPRTAANIDLGEFNVPLTADFTTPDAYLFNRSNFFLQGLTGLVTGGDQTHYGLFLHEPYNPDKIPLILVHGLFSSPLAWTEVTNDLVGDPLIRTHYQIWHYGYPTSYPFLFSAWRFREQLEDLRATLDPEGDDPAMAAMVVVGHSMGGLLAKTLVTDSGDALWNQIFKVPPEALDTTPSELEMLRAVLRFQPKPYVHRVIFMATPHRGSESSNSLVGLLGAGLAKFPADYRETMLPILKRNLDKITFEFRPFVKNSGPTSIQVLDPANPMIQAFSRLEIDRFVPFHSMMGDRGRGDGPQGSDGLITYASAHLEHAASELIVPASHSVYNHPLALEELRRILAEHLFLELGVEADPGSQNPG